MYTRIINPNTGKKVNINSKLGKNILNNYIKLLGGAAASHPIIGIDLNTNKKSFHKLINACYKDLKQPTGLDFIDLKKECKKRKIYITPNMKRGHLISLLRNNLRETYNDFFLEPYIAAVPLPVEIDEMDEIKFDTSMYKPIQYSQIPPRARNQPVVPLRPKELDRDYFDINDIELNSTSDGIGPPVPLKHRLTGDPWLNSPYFINKTTNRKRPSRSKLPGSLKKNKKKNVGSKPKWQCDICQLELYSQQFLKRHKKTCEKKKCPHCKYVSGKTQQLQDHIDSGICRITFTCDICKQTLKSRNFLKRHLVKRHKYSIKDALQKINETYTF